MAHVLDISTEFNALHPEKARLPINFTVVARIVLRHI